MIDYLLANSHEIGIFRYPGRAEVRSLLLSMLEEGDVAGLKRHLEPGMEMECSAALTTFIEHLQPPLLPTRVQRLILGHNDVSDRVIALDALGLLFEESQGKYLLLVTKMFDLLYLVSCNSRRTELSTISVAVILLPVFFHIKNNWADQWEKASLIFHEMILLSQEYEK